METKEMEKQENTRKGLGVVLKKASDIAKKTVGGVQKGVTTITEKTKQSYHDYQMEKYRPLTEEEFRSESFNLPNIIEIVDDAVRRKIAVCEGAVGWLEEHKGVEILHLYDEFVKNCGLVFVPVAQCDSVYCVDNFDRARYIDTNSIFEKATAERMAELAHIAYSLGAKKCTIEIVEENSRSSHSQRSVRTSANKASKDQEMSSAASNRMSGKRELLFEGNNTPVAPTLKWFSHDDNIKGLIEMRCSGNNSIQSTALQLCGASSATVSKKVACAVDQLLKVSGSASMESRAVKEHSSKLIVNIDF